MIAQKDIIKQLGEHLPLSEMINYCKLAEEFRPLTVGEQETFVLQGHKVAYGLRRGNVSGCIVEITEDKNLVIMQQSNDILDFVFNALIPKVPYVSREKVRGKIHAGFYILWKAIEKRFHKRVQMMDPKKTKTFYIAGHSLGAPLGVLAAEFLTEKGYKVGPCVFTGAPRMGNRQFKEWVESRHKIIRITHGWDVVTVLPPVALLYRHVGKAFYLMSGALHIKSPFRRNCPIPYLVKGIKDHNMGLYIRKLIEALQIKHKT